MLQQDLFFFVDQEASSCLHQNIFARVVDALDQLYVQLHPLHLPCLHAETPHILSIVQSID